MKSRVLLPAMAVAALVVMSNASQAHAFGLFNRLHGGCCAVEASCCEPELTCCEPEPTCCEPEPTCCEPVSCCDPCGGCHRPVRDFFRRLFSRHSCCDPCGYSDCGGGCNSCGY